MALLQAQAKSALGRLEPRPLPFPMANMMLTRTGSTTLPFAAGVTSLPWKSCLDSLCVGVIASVAEEGHEARHDAVVGPSPVGQVIATCADVVPMSIALPMAEAPPIVGAQRKRGG